MLAILMFTPAMEYLPIPNPAMEARYGRQLLETQQQLHTLAEDVILLREYNTNLRHALGQENGQGPVVELRDSASRQQNMTPPQPVTRGGPTHVQASSADDLVEVQQQTGSAPSTPVAAMVDYNRVAPQARRLELPLLLPVEGFVSQGYDLAAAAFRSRHRREARIACPGARRWPCGVCGMDVRGREYAGVVARFGIPDRVQAQPDTADNGGKPGAAR